MTNLVNADTEVKQLFDRYGDGSKAMVAIGAIMAAAMVAGAYDADPKKSAAHVMALSGKAYGTDAARDTAKSQLGNFGKAAKTWGADSQRVIETATRETDNGYKPTSLLLGKLVKAFPKGAPTDEEIKSVAGTKPDKLEPILGDYIERAMAALQEALPLAQAAGINAGPIAVAFQALSANRDAYGPTAKEARERAEKKTGDAAMLAALANYNASQS